MVALRLASGVRLDRRIDLRIGEIRARFPAYLLGGFDANSNGNGTRLALLGRVGHGCNGIMDSKLYDEELTGVNGTLAVEVSGFDGRATIVGGEQVIKLAVAGTRPVRTVMSSSRPRRSSSRRRRGRNLGIALVAIRDRRGRAALRAVRDQESDVVDCTPTTPFTHLRAGSTMKIVTLAAVRALRRRELLLLGEQLRSMMGGSRVDHFTPKSTR